MSDAPGLQERLERVQELMDQAIKAREAGDWRSAILALNEAEKLVDDVLKETVNEARVRGRLTDSQIAEIRGTSRSAVQQRFGSRAALLRAIWPDREVEGEDE